MISKIIFEYDYLSKLHIYYFVNIQIHLILKVPRFKCKNVT